MSIDSSKIDSPYDRRLVQQCAVATPSQHCTVGPGAECFTSCEVANQFLFWFPAGKPAATSMAVASSRLSQKLDEQTGWFDALRTLAVQTTGESRFFVTALGTTTDPFIRRVSELFCIPVVELVRFPDSPPEQWFHDQFVKGQGATPLASTAYYKPLEESAATDLNINDLLIGIAMTSVLLSVRKNGNIATGAQRRLDCDPTPDTRLLIDRQLTPAKVESDLIENGATAWWLFGQPGQRDDSGAASKPLSPRFPAQQTNAVILTLDEIDTEGFLLHWTRRRVGPWPDQSNPEYLDDLIFRTARREHSPLAALCRILASGRIYGTHELTRDPRPVVCLSSLPLDRIAARRTFRRHLSRWDFELLGIAIDRDLLRKLGARPVIYGTESEWKHLAEIDRAYFQLKQTETGQIDWQSELEWRVLGDLKLADIACNAAVVFVDSMAAAETVSQLSHWPVVVLNK